MNLRRRVVRERAALREHQLDTVGRAYHRRTSADNQSRHHTTIWRTCVIGVLSGSYSSEESQFMFHAII
jgi:hypothetical protein